jgi:serine/threonine protein phosphatase 1
VLGRFRSFIGGSQRKGTEPEVLPRRKRLVVAPPNPVVYAIGDVHGCLAQLIEAEARIAEDRVPRGAMKLIVPLGDYVDRGPDSAGVLEYLSGPSPHDIERVCLCGNHDDAMAAFVRDPLDNLGWLSVGGDATLKSYGIDPVHALQPRRRGDLRGVLAGAVPAHHLSFIDSLPVCLKVGDVVFVHAGLDPTRSLEDQTDEDMMWIREPFMTTGPGIPVTVVHGHTPSVDITTGPGRIGIDTAACVTGKLSVLKVEEGTFTLL